MTADPASLDQLHHQALTLARCLGEASLRPATADWWLAEARIAHHRLGVALDVEVGATPANAPVTEVT